jgi:hypothetical protein
MFMPSPSLLAKPMVLVGADMTDEQLKAAEDLRAEVFGYDNVRFSKGYIETGKLFPVCGNTCYMLKDMCFADYSDFIGDFACHYGIFEECGTAMPYDEGGSSSGNAAPCC